MDNTVKHDANLLAPCTMFSKIILLTKKHAKSKTTHMRSKFDEIPEKSNKHPININCASRYSLDEISQMSHRDRCLVFTGLWRRQLKNDLSYNGFAESWEHVRFKNNIQYSEKVDAITGVTHRSLELTVVNGGGKHLNYLVDVLNSHNYRNLSEDELRIYRPAPFIKFWDVTKNSRLTCDSSLPKLDAILVRNITIQKRGRSHTSREEML